MNTQMFQDRPARRSRARAAAIGIMVVLALLVSTLAAAAGQGASGQPSADAPVMAPQGGSTIGDYVWCDVNRDGKQDEGNAGINGVLLELWIWEEGTGWKPVLDTLGNPVTQTTRTIDTITGKYAFQDTLGRTQYEVWVSDTNFAPGGPLHDAVPTPNDDNQQPFTTGDRPYVYQLADFGYDGPMCHQTAVALSSFSAGPTANLLLVGLGGAILIGVSAVWSARRRRAAVPQQ